jgi:single-stranded DNA-binding protein
MNLCILSGVAVKNSEIKTAGQDYTFIKFSIGVKKYSKNANGIWQNETMWVNASASGENAKKVDGFTKGTTAIFEGALDISTYEKDGKKMYYTSLRVNRISDVVKKNEAPQSQLDLRPTSPEQLEIKVLPKATSIQANPDFAGDDIPF